MCSLVTLSGGGSERGYEWLPTIDYAAFPKVFLAASLMFVLDSVDAERDTYVSHALPVHSPFCSSLFADPISQALSCDAVACRTRWAVFTCPHLPCRDKLGARTTRWWSEEVDHLARRRRPLHFGRRRRANVKVDVDVDVDVGGGSRRSIRNSVRPGGHVAAGRSRSGLREQLLRHRQVGAELLVEEVTSASVEACPVVQERRVRGVGGLRSQGGGGRGVGG